jgi:hypothetical protein
MNNSMEHATSSAKIGESAFKEIRTKMKLHLLTKVLL